MTTPTGQPARTIGIAVALATVAVDVGLEPLVVRASVDSSMPDFISAQSDLAPALLLAISGGIGLLLLVRQPKGLRLPVAAGLLVGTGLALVIVLVLIINELNALGTTGV